MWTLLLPTFFILWKELLVGVVLITCMCFVQQIVTQFKMQGVNTALYYKNKEMEDTFNIVPTSAVRHDQLLVLLVHSFRFLAASTILLASFP